MNAGRPDDHIDTRLLGNVQESGRQRHAGRVDPDTLGVLRDDRRRATRQGKRRQRYIPVKR
ncbi:hypothetical protein O6W96_13795 [Sphingomonas faeni]